VIVAMPPMGNEHVNTSNELLKRFLFKFSNRARVTSQTPLRLKAAFSEPELDVMLCKPGSRGTPASRGDWHELHRATIHF
jgi:hypothetical protein